MIDNLISKIVGAMTLDQLSEWEGVRAWQESHYSNDADRIHDAGLLIERAWEIMAKCQLNSIQQV